MVRSAGSAWGCSKVTLWWSSGRIGTTTSCESSRCGGAMRGNAKPTKGSKVNAQKEPREQKIVRVTAKQAKQMPSQTDWKRVRALTDADIAKAVAGDDDTFEFTDDMLAQVRAVHAEPKDLVSLRLDRSI